MAAAEDLEIIRRQEAELVFDSFDEHSAFTLGAAVRELAMAENLGIVADISLWNRQLFYMALPGSTGSNPHWVRRKFNTVRLYLKSTYRMVLEQNRPDRTFAPGQGLDPADYVLAGGGFPIAVRNAGVIGAITVSGLPERNDHGMAVRALCRVLDRDEASYALGPQA